MRKIFFTTIAFLIVTVFSVVAQKYILPMDIKPALSGNFGEIRPNHFHTGLDYKTQGKVGIPVRAVADGYLHRIYVSHRGYGKALYINHPEGITSVYGHLNRFADTINEIALQCHYEKESFWLNYIFSSDSIKVKKGDVIAYSGNTGSSGGPHLHFEIRDTKTEQPLNPLRYGFDLVDDMRPHLGGVLVSGVKNGGAVNGDSRSYFSTVFYDGAFHIKGKSSIQAWGDIGVGFYGFDYLTGDWSKCGVYKAELFVDGEMIYTHELDTLSFNTLRHLNAFIDYKYKKEKYRTVQKCYVDKPNNGLNIYRNLMNKGIISIDEPRNYKVKLNLYDANGNLSKIAFTIKGTPQEVKTKEISDEVVRFIWNKKNVYNDSGIVFEIPDSALYDDIYFECERVKMAGFLSDIFHVHNGNAALNDYCTLKIKPVGEVEDSSQVVIVEVNSKGRIISYCNSKLTEEGFYETKVRSFGRYALAVDSVFPHIKSLDLNGKFNIKKYKNIQFKIYDRSGISRIDGYIDGKWVLFDYEAKKNLLIHTFDESRIKRDIEHSLVLEIEDGAGNISKFEKRFVW